MEDDCVNILAVDDTPGCLLILEYVLADLKVVRFFGATSGAEAIRLTEEYDFAAILADVSMQGMGGFEMTRRIKDQERSKGTPVIFVSGQLHDFDFIEQVYRSGGVDSMVKPIDPKVLKSKVSIFAEIYLERKRLKRAIFQQLEMKNQFLSQVSHELRTPLNSLYQFLQIIESEKVGSVSAEQKKILNIALRNAVELKEMIDDLMEVTRIENGKLSINRQKVSLPAIFDGVKTSLRQLATMRGMSIQISVEKELPVVCADPKRIRQIVVNLVTNAIRYGTEGMAIKVSAGVAQHDASMAEIMVSDEGPGIDPDRIPHIFDRLYQAEERADVSRHGLGLGLFICKEFVEAHGGFIDVHCPSEGGSIFRFTISIEGKAPPNSVTNVDTNRLNIPIFS